MSDHVEPTTEDQTVAVEADFGPLPVLFLIPSLERGGAEGQLIMLINALDRQRYRPILCCLSAVEPERRREVHCEVVHIEMPSLFRPSALAAFLRIDGLIRRHRVRVVQACFLRAEVLGVLARLLHRLQTRVILAKRDLEHYSYGWRERSLARFAHWGSDVVVGNAMAVTNRLESVWNVRRDRSAVIYNGIDLTRFAPVSAAQQAAAKGRLSFPPGTCVVMLVAHLVPVKGVESFIDAAGMIARELPDARFVVVGGGSLLCALELRARAEGVDARIRFAGEISDVRSYLEAADIGVLSSLSEGLPNAVLEYMAMGLPAVATDVGGVRELLGADGECGFIVPAGRHAALAARLLELARDPALRALMGGRGRQRAERLFDSRRTVKQYEQLFERLAERIPWG